MPSPFDITTASNTLTLDNNRQGVAVFTVKNNLRRRIHATARVTTTPPLPDSKWVKILPPTDNGANPPEVRDIPIDGSTTIDVQVIVPADASAGSYAMILSVADEIDPDDNFTNSPDVTFTVLEAPKPVPRPFPLWIIPAVLIAVAIIVGLIIVLSRNNSEPIPDPPIFSSGHLDIPQTFLADLDSGQVTLDGQDIFFQAQTATIRFITPVQTATIALMGTNQPSFADCNAAPLAATPIPIQSVPAGTFLCVRTDAGRISRLRVTATVGSSPGTLSIDFTTFNLSP